jgi:hypothetical protein
MGDRLAIGAGWSRLAAVGDHATAAPGAPERRGGALDQVAERFVVAELRDPDRRRQLAGRAATPGTEAAGNVLGPPDRAIEVGIDQDGREAPRRSARGSHAPRSRL